jgi:hypothetical protein
MTSWSWNSVVSGGRAVPGLLAVASQIGRRSPAVVGGADRPGFSGSVTSRCASSVRAGSGAAGLVRPWCSGYVRGEVLWQGWQHCRSGAVMDEQGKGAQQVLADAIPAYVLAVGLAGPVKISGGLADDRERLREGADNSSSCEPGAAHSAEWYEGSLQVRVAVPGKFLSPQGFRRSSQVAACVTGVTGWDGRWLLGVFRRRGLPAWRGG